MLSNRSCESARSLRSTNSGGSENGGVVLERGAAGAALYQRSDLQRQRDDVGTGTAIRIRSPEHGDADRGRQRGPARLRRETPAELEREINSSRSEEHT